MDSKKRPAAPEEGSRKKLKTDIETFAQQYSVNAEERQDPTLSMKWNEKEH